MKDTENLIAVHNLSEEKLNKVMELGGFAMPSIAIIKEEYNFDEFGDITFLPHKRAIDPTNRNNKIYEADAYTARVPEVFYQFDAKKVREALKITEEEMSAWKLEDILNGSPLPQLFQVARQLYGELNRHNRMRDEDISVADVEKVLSDAVKEKGLYNGKDIYTSAGGRRSFKALTIPYTLDNVFKMMKKGRNQEQMLLSGSLSEWRASLAGQYKEFDEIPADRIITDGSITKQAYDDLGDRLSDLEVFIAERMEGVSMWDRYEYIGRALEQIKDRSSDMTINNAFMANCGVELTYEECQELRSIGKEVQELPVTYIEAKPERIVSFEEMSAVIIPDTISKKTKAKLESICRTYDIEIYEYDIKKDNRHDVLREAVENHPEVIVKECKEIEKSIRKQKER